MAGSGPNAPRLDTSEPTKQEIYDLLLREFYAFDHLTPVQRLELGLPTSIAKFAKAHNISDRTVQRWRRTAKWEEAAAELKVNHDGDIVAYLAAVRAEMKARLKGTLQIGEVAEPPAWAQQVEITNPDPDAPEDSSDYGRIKATMVKQALSGDQRSQDLYFKTFGKHLLEADKEQRERGFTHLEDLQLVEEFAKAVGDELMAQAGWVRSA